MGQPWMWAGFLAFVAAMPALAAVELADLVFAVDSVLEAEP